MKKFIEISYSCLPGILEPKKIGGILISYNKECLLIKVLNQKMKYYLHNLELINGPQKLAQAIYDAKKYQLTSAPNESVLVE